MRISATLRILEEQNWVLVSSNFEGLAVVYSPAIVFDELVAVAVDVAQVASLQSGMCGHFRCLSYKLDDAGDDPYEPYVPIAQRCEAKFLHLRRKAKGKETGKEAW